MRLTGHVIASLATGGAAYAATGSVPLALAAGASGVAIDTDHWVDYWVRFGPRLSLRRFFAYHYGHRQRLIVVPLHSVELWTIWWAAALWGLANPVWVGVGLGCTVHLLIDQVTNGVRPLGYFLIYRLLHRFGVRAILVGAGSREREGAGGGRGRDEGEGAIESA